MPSAPPRGPRRHSFTHDEDVVHLDALGRAAFAGLEAGDRLVRRTPVSGGRDRWATRRARRPERALLAGRPRCWRDRPLRRSSGGRRLRRRRVRSCGQPSPLVAEQAQPQLRTRARVARPLGRLVPVRLRGRAGSTAMSSTTSRRPERPYDVLRCVERPPPTRFEPTGVQAIAGPWFRRSHPGEHVHPPQPADGLAPASAPGRTGQPARVSHSAPRRESARHAHPGANAHAGGHAGAVPVWRAVPHAGRLVQRPERSGHGHGGHAVRAQRAAQARLPGADARA